MQKKLDTIVPDEIYREKSNSTTIEMTSQNVELLNRRNERRTCNVKAMETTGGWQQQSKETDGDSPPNSPRRENLSINNNNNFTKARGAVPRRTGSCSSSGSSSSRSTNSRNSPSTLPYRSSTSKSSSPALSYNKNMSHLDHSSYIRKVSSPTQTEGNGFWERMVSSPSQTSRCDQDTSPNSRRKPGRTCRSISSVSTSSSSSNSKASSFSSPRNSPVDETKPSSPCVSPQPGIEALTFVQRTEVVLRVNAATSDAASQTDCLAMDNECKMEDCLAEPRKKSPEEIECEELSRDLASQLNPNDKLLPILGMLCIINIFRCRVYNNGFDIYERKLICFCLVFYIKTRRISQEMSLIY